MQKLLYLLLLLPYALHAQQSDTIKVPFKGSQIFYESVVTLDTPATKVQIYKAAKMWFAETFHDSKSVIQVADQESGEIFGKGYFDLPSTNGISSTGLTWHVNIQINFEAKDNKYRIQVFGFNSPDLDWEHAYKEYIRGMNMFGKKLRQNLWTNFNAYNETLLLNAELYIKDKIKTQDNF